jgi:hypothetical protein
MKLLALLILLNLSTHGSDQPRKSTSDGTLSETKKVLDAFQGTWLVVEKYDPSESKPNGGIGQGVEIWRSGPGQRSVIEEYHSTSGQGDELTGFGLGWWEETSGGFRLNWCGDDDPKGCRRLSEVARWKGNVWVVRHTYHDNGHAIDFEEVFSDITPTSFAQTIY